MYFFVVGLGKKGGFLNRLFSWEFLFYQLLNQQRILQSSSNGRDIFLYVPATGIRSKQKQ